jgi:hypothetical protein
MKRMSNGAQRGSRGWFYAMLVAGSMFAVFYFGNTYNNFRRPIYRDPRTSFLTVSTSVNPKQKIAAPVYPSVLASEPLENLVNDASWLDYNRPSTHSVSLFSPPASATLFAPSTTGLESLEETISYGRAPEMLAATQATQPQPPLELVSKIKEVKEAQPKTSLTARSTVSHLAPSQNWPEPKQLNEQIESVKILLDPESDQKLQTWLADLSTSLDALAQSRLNEVGISEILAHIRNIGSEFAAYSSFIASDRQEVSASLARLAYSIERRVSVWSAIHTCVRKPLAPVSLRLTDSNELVFSQVMDAKDYSINNELLGLPTHSLTDSVDAVRALIARTGQPESWKSYLMLDEIVALNAPHVDRESKGKLARQFLNRVLATHVTSEQSNFLRSDEIRELAAIVHPWTVSPVDYRQLLEDIEMLESNPTHRCSVTLSDAIQSLRFSANPEQAAISQAIASHYKNANVRVAISEMFVNRMLPQSNTVEKPVRQNILGADTRGASVVTTKLRADFKPDDYGWTIALNLDGDISSQTKSSRNGATFYSQSLANVNAERLIRIRPQGFEINGKPASVQSSDSLKKMSTEWDNLPIFGDIVRRIAKNEFMEKRPVARRITKTTIARETDREFDMQLNSKIRNSQTQFESRLLSPLQGLSLEPTIVSMNSTEERLIVRYRVASDSQMGANTARPIAPADSLISVQIHQSAFNNLASQIVTGGRDWSAQELADHISDLLKQPRKTLELEQGEDVRVRFQPNNPITLDFQDGKLWLTLRIESIEQPGRLHIKNFNIHVAYQPAVHGLWAGLQRDGTVSVEGPKLSARDRLPLRTIFTKVLANQEAIPVVADWILEDKRAQGLAVSQLVLRDGWIGVAISEANSPHVAILEKTMQR